MNDGYSDVLRNIASSEPTPGGGSVAALSLAHAHALALMMSRLTFGREKWKDGHDAAENVISSSEMGMKLAQDLAWEDATAFNRVMDAYRMPKESDAENDAFYSGGMNCCYCCCCGGWGADADIGCLKTLLLFKNSVRELCLKMNNYSCNRISQLKPLFGNND